MILEDFNQLPEAQAKQRLLQCCTSSNWVNKLQQARPFEDGKALFTAADKVWQDLSEVDFLEAFEGHPKIGDVSSLREKYASTKQLASGEQAAVNHASEQLLNQLATGNDDYLNKFGFIFIVCASGKSADEMLALLMARLPNDRATELINAAAEQRKIFHIRLSKSLEIET